MATITKAQLQDKYDALVSANDHLKAERAGFIAKVIDVAGTAAREHDLCEVLEEVFSDLNITVPDTTITVTRTETYTMPGFAAYRLGLAGEDLSPSELRAGMEDHIAWNGPTPTKSEVIDVTLSTV